MISVVIPTRNRASLLARAIASAQAQTIDDLDIVVVDDGSTDHTHEVIMAAAGADPRIREIRHRSPGGAPRARNHGIEAARGTSVAFLDDDCVWAPEKLDRQARLLSADVGVVYCRHAIRTPQGSWIVEGEASAARDPLGALLRTNYIGTYTLLIDHALLRSAGGFDERLNRLQDWELLLRLARHTGFGFVPQTLVTGDLVPGGISSTPDVLPAAARTIIARHAPTLTVQQSSALHYGLGKFLLADGLTPEAKSFFRTAVRLHPTSVINWSGLIASYLGPRFARAIRGSRRHRRRAARWDPADRAPVTMGDEPS